MLYSPLNYQGNKSRIVDSILAVLPTCTTAVHEVFCGSAILSFASNVKRVYLNDTDTNILRLIEFFKCNKAIEIIDRADSIIAQYGLTNTFYEGKIKYPETKHEGLSRYNRAAYEVLRRDYNADNDIAKLFVLIIYGFNHFLRFNSKGEYNVPVGKVDFVKSLRQKTIEYCDAIHSKDIKLSNMDFRSEELYKGFKETDIFYFDPPYLVTQAPYNVSWSVNEEKDLLKILDKLNSIGYHFILSNVVKSNGRTNEILTQWMSKYNIRHIHRQYLNSSYQKKNLGAADEIIIMNY